MPPPQLVHKYVELFVLCPSCKLPETEYKIKNEVIFHKCAACGAKEAVDMTHKLCTYILAQHKKAKKEAAKGGKGKKEKKEKKEGKEKKEKKVRPRRFVESSGVCLRVPRHANTTPHLT